MTDDPINPAHYAAGGLQSIDVIEAFVPDKPHRWAALKYLFRAGKKDPAKEAEDLRKAIWWIEREIKMLEARVVSTFSANTFSAKEVTDKAFASWFENRDRILAAPPTGCAGDCVHPSHAHAHQKMACLCRDGNCLADQGRPPKWTFCKKAEAAAEEPQEEKP